MAMHTQQKKNIYISCELAHPQNKLHHPAWPEPRRLRELEVVILTRNGSRNSQELESVPKVFPQTLAIIIAEVCLPGSTVGLDKLFFFFGLLFLLTILVSVAHYSC